MPKIRMTEYSHGSGCGCKISPKVLDSMLQTHLPEYHDANLLVGNQSRDDAAVYDQGNGTAIISTTDFFMPIVDDPFTFGQVAATNAISDIYAMGGKPVMAIAIFGWPLDKLPAEVAQQVIDGGRSVCHEAGISLAGGHSIDAPEPIFGLAVTGTAATHQLKRNDQARAGNRIYLTKPLGIGILTTAQKQQKLKEEHQGVAEQVMCTLNQVGTELSRIAGVSAMTDVTGFGLGGHLREVCEGSGLAAHIHFDQLPLLPGIPEYIAQGCSPGGAHRNFESYGHLISDMSEEQQSIVCDPQTSGGLLVMVDEQAESDVVELLSQQGLQAKPIGYLQAQSDNAPLIKVS